MILYQVHWEELTALYMSIVESTSGHVHYLTQSEKTKKLICYYYFKAEALESRLQIFRST